ncbi:SDR family NAD(P)-dependent oxidoreductase, partial [Priestia sp. SIMBA_032]
SGMGRVAALELAAHGTVVLVGRDRRKLDEVAAEIEARPGGQAVAVVADFSDIRSARRAASEIAALGLPLAGVANNAGMMATTPSAAERKSP